MTQKKLIYADKKDKTRMICENLRREASASICVPLFSFVVALARQHGRLSCDPALHYQHSEIGSSIRLWDNGKVINCARTF